jgi:hypothetical protein
MGATTVPSKRWFRLDFKENTVDDFGIGWAVKQLNNGLLVRRRGWNGKGMFLGLQVPDEHSMNKAPYVWIMPVDGRRVPWVCSQADLLATDWEIVS